MPKIHRSLWLPLALFVYITGSFIYLGINGRIPSTANAYGMIVLAYALLALVTYLRVRRIRREKQMNEELDRFKKNGSDKGNE